MNGRIQGLMARKCNNIVINDVRDDYRLEMKENPRR
jgi:hypothetical protein